MPARVSEAFVLQTWPFKEGDLIVSFLTRDLGKLRGVARRARRPKSGFGSGLERLSHIRMSYFQRENRELVNIDSCDLVQSQFGLLERFSIRPARSIFWLKFPSNFCPPPSRAKNISVSLTAILEHLRSGGTRRRLARRHLLQPLGREARRAFFPNSTFASAAGHGWKIPKIRSAPSSAASRRALLPRLPPRARSQRNLGTVAAESRAIAEEILHTPIGQLTRPRCGPRATAADLRRFLAQQMESHIERKLITVPVLEAAA